MLKMKEDSAKPALNCLVPWQVVAGCSSLTSDSHHCLQCVIIMLQLLQAVLMIGFQEHEIQAFRSVMLEMDADMVKVSFA